MKTLPSPEIIAAVQQIIQTAMSTPSDVADVFVDYYGHTGSVDVRVHDYGWVRDADCSVQWHCYTDDDEALKSLIRTHGQLSERLARLESTKGTPRAVEDKAAQLRKAAANLLDQAAKLTPAPAA